MVVPREKQGALRVMRGQLKDHDRALCAHGASISEVPNSSLWIQSLVLMRYASVTPSHTGPILPDVVIHQEASSRSRPTEAGRFNSPPLDSCSTL